jgi:hypothetical protein
MAVTRIASSVSGEATTIAVDKPTGTLDGHYIVLVFSHTSGNEPDLTGTDWAVIYDNEIAEGARIVALGHFANSDPATYEIPWLSGSTGVITMAHTYSGVNTTTPTGTAVSNPDPATNDTPGPFVSASVTAIADDSILFVILSDEENDPDGPYDRGTPASMTLLQTGFPAFSNRLLTTYDEPVDTGATGTRTAASGHHWNTGAFIINPAGGGGGSYTLVCAQGSFGVTGQAATLAPSTTHTLVCAQGALALSGSSAALHHAASVSLDAMGLTVTGFATGVVAQRRLTLAQGSYAITGQVVTLTAPNDADAVLPCAQGGFALIGQAATPRAARRLVAAAGSLAIGGNAAGLRAGRRCVMAPGSLAITGPSTALRLARRLVAAQGSFAITGPATSLRAAHRMTAAQGAYAVGGSAATLTASQVRTLVAASGSYAVTGYAIPLGGSRSVMLSGGTLGITGNATLLRVARRLVAVAGAYGLTGHAAALVAAHALAAAPGTLAIAGGPMGVARGRAVALAAGLFAITGRPCSPHPARALLAIPGAYTLTGRAVALTYSAAITFVGLCVAELHAAATPTATLTNAATPSTTP